MSTIVVDLQSYNRENSKTATSWVGTTSANSRNAYPIHEGIKIHIFRPDATALVIQPFYVEVRLVGGEYIASSNISNSFEFGETPGQAIKNYLELLVDKLIWLEKHEPELSPSIRKDLGLLQRYVRIV